MRTTNLHRPTRHWRRRLRAALLAALVASSASSTAWAHSIIGPYIEITYDMSGSTFQITGTPLMLGDGTFDIGPGEMTIQWEVVPNEATPEEDDFDFVPGTEVRLVEFTLDESFDVRGVFTDLTVQLLTGGDMHGTFVVDPFWGAAWHTRATKYESAGNVNCTLGGLCSLAGLVQGINPQHTVVDEPIPAFRLTFGGGGYWYNMGIDGENKPTWTLAPDPSGSTKYLRLRGLEVSVSEMIDTHEPIVRLKASPTELSGPGNVTLSWRAGGDVDDCTADGDWAGTKALTGTQVVAANIGDVFVLDCEYESSPTIRKTVTIGRVPTGQSNTVVEFAATKDTSIYIDRFADPQLADEAVVNSANGLGSTLFVNGLGEPTSAGVTRSLIAFDVSALPTDVAIMEAKLEMNRTAIPGEESNVQLQLMEGDWGEGTSVGSASIGGVATTGDATWQDAFFSATPWNNAGGDFDVLVAPTAVTDDTELGNTTWETVFVAADTQLWISDPSRNFGWLLRDVVNEAQGNKAEHRFDSREGTVPPKLTVEYDSTCSVTNLDVNGLLNDECSDDVAVSPTTLCPTVVSQSTLSATADGATALSACALAPETPPSNSVWYSYTPAHTGFTVISTEGTAYPTTIAVWHQSEGCGALLDELACGADSDALSVSENVVTVKVSANVTYLVQVGDVRGGGVGGADLQVRFSGIPRPGGAVIIPEPGALLGAFAALGTLAGLAQHRRTRR